MNMTETIQKIAKESVHECSFISSPRNSEQGKEIENRLHSAMLLGNNYRSKVRITFSTRDGLREVETTVWAYTEKYVVLKGGIFLPVNSVVSVDF
jgi:hypothetical protein